MRQNQLKQAISFEACLWLRSHVPVGDDHQTALGYILRKPVNRRVPVSTPTGYSDRVPCEPENSNHQSHRQP